MLLALLVVIGAGFRFWGLGANRLGFDESFTAMAGRLPLGDLVHYLRVRDSHPPLDYLLRAPLSRAGAGELVLRLPSVACSIGALALFAWWMRRRGLAGIVATAVLALSAFQLVHGRDARMYSVMALVGVGAAVLADVWSSGPRRWHAVAIGVLTLTGLLTHASMFLLVAGLVTLAGLRTDRDAWRWRCGLLGGVLGWAVLWGPTFVAQSQGGHSSWIPRTSVSGFVEAVGNLVTYRSTLHLGALAIVGVGAVILWRADRRLARVWTSCFAVPVLLAALLGIVAPVLLDRTLTVVAWGPALAIGFFVDGISRWSRVIAAVVIVLLGWVAIPAAVDVVTVRSSPDIVLRRIEAVLRPGDVVAIHPGARLHELTWSLGVRGPLPFEIVRVNGLGNTRGMARGNGPLSGRVWLLDWNRQRLPVPSGARCAADWKHAGARLYCLAPSPAVSVRISRGVVEGRR